MNNYTFTIEYSKGSRQSWTAVYKTEAAMFNKAVKLDAEGYTLKEATRETWTDGKITLIEGYTAGKPKRIIWKSKG